MFKIYTQTGIIETESYEEVLKYQSQGCTYVDLRDIDQDREYRVIGEAFLIDTDKL